MDLGGWGIIILCEPYDDTDDLLSFGSRLDVFDLISWKSRTAPERRSQDARSNQIPSKGLIPSIVNLIIAGFVFGQSEARRHA